MYHTIYICIGRRRRTAATGLYCIIPVLAVKREALTHSLTHLPILRVWATQCAATAAHDVCPVQVVVIVHCLLRSRVGKPHQAERLFYPLQSMSFFSFSHAAVKVVVAQSSKSTARHAGAGGDGGGPARVLTVAWRARGLGGPHVCVIIIL